MRFSITKDTKLSDFPFHEELTEEQKCDILKWSDMDYGSLTVSDLFDMVEGKTPKTITDMITEDITVVDYIAVTFGLQRFLEYFTKKIEEYSIKPTPDESAAMAGVCRATFQEAVLFSLRNYFGSKSFEDVEKLTLTDYLLATKDIYMKAKTERNLNEIYKRKISKKI